MIALASPACTIASALPPLSPRCCEAPSEFIAAWRSHNSGLRACKPMLATAKYRSAILTENSRKILKTHKRVAKISAHRM